MTIRVRMVRLAAAAAMIVTGTAARAASCSPDAQDLPAPEAGFLAPTGASTIIKFEVRASDGSSSTVDLAPRTPPAPGAPIGAELQDRLARGAPATDALVAVWKVGSGECRQTIRTPAPKVSPLLNLASKAAASSTASGLSEEECPTTGDPLANCQQCATAWRGRLGRELRGHNYSLAVYTESGDACLIQNGTVGEPILFAIYSEESTQWDALKIDPCSIEPDAPSVFVSTPGLNLDRARQAERYYLRRYPSRRCYNPVLDIRVTGKKGGNPLLVDHPLQQSQRYRATLQLGAVFTEQHLRSFALRPSPGGTVIFDQGPTGRGTEYQASLVLYALPKNLLTIFGVPYAGRDLVRDQGILDRLGGLVGVSLSDPSRRFYAGLSFEVLYGVNVTWGVEFFRGRELAGVAVGDAFSASDSIPTRERWDWDKVWGISLDLLYVKQLWGGRTPQ